MKRPMRILRPGLFRLGRGPALLGIGCALLAACGAQAATIDEPATVFYGKIVGTGSSRSFLVTDGDLHWTIRRADGTSVHLGTRLWHFKNGEFSYRLNVPHEVLGLGLDSSGDTVPLKTVPETHTITEITVDGVPAHITGTTASTFDAEQARRAATYRLDLEVPLEPTDSDGDGLPDWWESQYGRDLNPADDLDTDGLSNLQEFRAGSDPLQDTRRPTLLTTAVHAVADGISGVLLRAADSDSPAALILYTLTRAPEGVELRLRNARSVPGDADAAVTPGGTWSQQDVNCGRLVLVHSGGPATPTSFDVSIRDEDPTHPAGTGTVQVDLYRPTAELVSSTTDTLAMDGPAPAGVTPDEWRRAQLYRLARDLGVVIWDATGESADLSLSAPSSSADAADYTQRFGYDRSQALLGGNGADRLSGGMADDLLAGEGGANVLTGGGGADRFAFHSGDQGVQTITDFNPSEGDVLDLTDLLDGTSPSLLDYLRASGTGDQRQIEVDRHGTHTAFADLVVRIPGAGNSPDLHQLLESGNLAVGTLALPPRITVSATRPSAAENGPTPGEFTLTRSGGLTATTVVHLDLRGSAANGIDYATAAPVVTFKPGERTAQVAIQPFADSQAEPAEIVELILLAGEGYEIGSADRAQVTIADLQPVVTVEALEPLATLQPVKAGTILVSRSVIVDRTLLVRLDIRGSAANGSDYQTTAKFVQMDAGQTTALVPITPVTDASAGTQAKSVLISVVPDPAYLVGAQGRAEVLIVRQSTTFAAWRASHFPRTPGTLEAFGGSDAGGKGIVNALRYAFGMDPENPDRTRMPKLVLRDGHLTVDVWRRPGAVDVEFTPVVSSDLAGWTGTAGLIEQVDPPGSAGDPDRICFRAVPSVTEAPRLFLELNVVFRP